jgi:hypothetical protein
MQVASTLQSDVDEVQRIAAGLPQTKRSALVSIGHKLLAREKAHFDQLTRSGSSLGVTWPGPAASTIKRRRSLQRRGLLNNVDPQQIGRLTGSLAAGFRFTVKGDRVSVVNVDPQAGYFAHKRPIFPPTMPDAWVHDSETILQRKLDQLSTPSRKESE